VAFDRMGRTLYSAGLDGNVFAWDLSGARAFARSFTTGPGSFTRPEIGHPYTYFSASSNGRIAVADAPRQLPSTGTSEGGDVNVIDVASGRVVTRLRIAGRVAGISSVSYAELSRNGRELVVSPGPLSDGDITLWRLQPGPPKLVRTFAGLTAALRLDQNGNGFWNAPWATLSRDGKWIAGVDRRADGTARLAEWNVATGAPRAAPLNLTWKATDDAVAENVVYSADGDLIASSVMGNRIALVDARTLRLIRTIPDPQGVAFVAFSPTNHDLLAEASSDVGLLRLWSVRTGGQIAQTTASNQAGLWSTAFDPSGRMLLTTGLDGVARLWSVPDLHQIGTDLPGRPDWHGVGAFAGHGSAKTAVVVYGDEAFTYPASLQTWEGQACRVAGRNFTRAEWAQYMGSRRYQKVCPP
jgi:WD40 repeat protein